MSHIVTLNYDPVWTALDWAKKHCPSYITNALHKETGTELATRIDYFFESKEDAVWFRLKWS